MSVNLSEQVASELLVHFFTTLTKKQKLMFMQEVINGGNNDSLNSLLEYIADPINYSHPDVDNKKVGDIVYVKIDALWSTDKAYMEEKDLIVDGNFQAKIVGYKFIPDTKIYIEYPSQEGLSKKDIYPSYTSKLDLL